MNDRKNILLVGNLVIGNILSGQQHNNALDFAERAILGFKNNQHLINAAKSDAQFSAETLDVFSRFSDILFSP